MSWEKDSFDAEATPVVGKIGEGGPPFFLLALCIVFVLETIDTFKLADAALIVLAIVLLPDISLKL